MFISNRPVSRNQTAKISTRFGTFSEVVEVAEGMGIRGTVLLDSARAQLQVLRMLKDKGVRVA